MSSSKGHSFEFPLIVMEWKWNGNGLSKPTKADLIVILFNMKIIKMTQHRKAEAQERKINREEGYNVRRNEMKRGVVRSENG